MMWSRRLVLVLLLAACGLAYGEIQASLQEMVDQAEDGAEVVVPEGIYRMEKGLELSGRSDLTVRGEGIVWITCTDPLENVVSIKECNIITLEGLKMRHDLEGGETGCEGAVLEISGSTEIYVQDCELSGSGAVGVLAVSTDTLEVNSCFIHRNTQNALVLNSCQNVTIAYNTIVDNNAFLSTSDVDNLEIYGNLIAYDSGE